MIDTTFQGVDYSELIHRYEKLLQEVRVFLEETQYPSVQSHVVRYITKCTKLESEVIGLRSEVSLTKAASEADYKMNLKHVYNNACKFDSIQKWQSDLIVHNESSVVDSKKVVDCLDSIESTLEEYKWLLKNNKELASQYYKFLSGTE